MATYVVTTSNWNSPAFWSGINQTGSGHTLDFTALPATFTVTYDTGSNSVTIDDGSTGFVIGDTAFAGTADATLGGTTVWTYFQTLSFGDASHFITSGFNGELITTGAGNDTIYANAGADTINAGEGDNVVYAGADNDTVTTGTGADQLFGEAGSDSLRGGGGNDFVDGGTGADVLYGDDGDDFLVGGWDDAAADTLYGGGGSDMLMAGGGTDRLHGGTGDDWLDGGWGNDTLFGEAGNDRMIGDEGNDLLVGDLGDDILSGGSGNDTLQGGDGSDSIWGAAGDFVDGGETGTDNDVLYVSDVASISYGGAENGTVFFNGGGSLTFTSIESVVTQANNYIVEGTAGDDNMGQFTVDADGDWIDNDDALGGGNQDSIRAAAGNDTVWANEGNDTVIGEDGNDLVYGGVGNDSLWGGDGNLLTADDTAGNDTIDGGDGADYLFGEAGDDMVIGGSGNDTVTGNEGADTLDAGAGDDWLQGGQGNDQILGGDGADSIVGDGQWYDTSEFASGPGINPTTLTITNVSDGLIELWWIDGSGTPIYYSTLGTSGATLNQATFEDHNWVLRDTDGYWLEVIAGAPDQTVVYGADGLDDSIDGGTGNDTIVAQYGDDTVRGGDDDDAINGGSGSDLLYGDSGNDTLFGGDGNDSIEGWVGDDVIDGGAGDDTMRGEYGNDTLTGGTGNDVFYDWQGTNLYDGGDDSDRFYYFSSGDLGNDTIIGGEGGTDDDSLDFSALSVGVTVTFGGVELGTASDGTDTLGFSEIETLTMTALADSVDGGADTLGIDVDGGAGDDTLIGGQDGDTLVGGLGNDYIDAGNGPNRIWGNEGDDYIQSGNGFDVIYGGTGNDTIYAGATSDTVYGGEGDDSIRGQGGTGSSDLLYGEDGNDTLEFDAANDTLDGGADADVFESSSTWGNASITGGETVTTGTDYDVLDFTGSAGTANVTFTAAEAGTVTGSGGATATFTGIEHVILSSRDDSADATGMTTGVSVDGGEGNDRFTGGLGDDYFDGGNGDFGSDSFYSSAGDDTFIGGDGWDFAFLTGTLGNGHIDLGVEEPGDVSTNDWIDFTFAETLDLTYTGAGGSVTNGTDTMTFNEVDGWSGTFDYGGTFDARAAVGYGVGVDIDGGWATLYGSAQNDTFWFSDAYARWVDTGDGDDAVLLGNGDGTVFGGAGDDYVRGLQGNDSLVGEADNDTLLGNDGADTLLGGIGNDRQLGGADADLFVIEDGFGADTIIGGETVTTGTDRDMLDFAGVTAGIVVAFSGAEAGTVANGADTLNFSEIEDIILTSHGDSIDASALASDGIEIDGHAGNDTLTGGGGADTLSGGDGDDSIAGGAGNDLLKTGQGQDTLDGGDGNDTLMNSAGDDSLIGGAGDDSLVASAGNDTLQGGTGNDTLYGGTGNDSLDGGADNDLLMGDMAGVDFNATGTDGVGIASGITDFPTSQITFEITFASTGFSGTEQYFVSYGSGANDNEFALSDDGTNLRVYVYNSVFDGPNALDTGIDMSAYYDGNPHTIAVTRDSATGETKVYVDGTEAYSGTYLPGGTLAQGGTLVLGQDQDVVGGSFDPAEIFEGEIYGVRLYDDVRTPAEVLDSALGPIADTSDPNLIANWVADADSASFTEMTGSHTMTLSGDVAATWSSGDDRLRGGTGDDTLYGGGGQDTIFVEDGFGNDSISGGEQGTDLDMVDLSAVTASGVTVTYSGDEAGGITDGADTITFDGIERLILTDQADTVNAIADTAGTDIDAGAGDDSIEYGQGNSTVLGGAGNDTIDDIDGTFYLGNDSLDGGDGDDLIWGGGGDDVILGGAGNDQIIGETGNDSITGGAGNDTIVYGTADGADTISDFNTGNTGTLADGDATNNDFINLSSYYDSIWELHADQADDGILNQSNALSSTGKAVDYSDNASFGAGSLTFTGASGTAAFFTVENTGVVCFTRGTLIATPRGEVPIEHLRPGDLVLTRDNGPQPLVWIGRRHIGRQKLARRPDLKPVLIQPDLVGAHSPLLVSPQHGMLLKVEGAERLVRATHLARTQGGKARVAHGCRGVTYMHLMFEAHQIVFANGAPSESFYPGDMAIGALPRAARVELASLFPDLPKRGAKAYGSTARSFATRQHMPERLAGLQVCSA